MTRLPALKLMVKAKHSSLFYLKICDKEKKVLLNCHQPGFNVGHPWHVFYAYIAGGVAFIGFQWAYYR